MVGPAGRCRLAGQNGPVTDAEKVVRELCDAVIGLEAAQLRPFFADDVVYHNIPLDPAVGLEATMGVLELFLGMFERVEFRIRHLACDGDIVLTERTDVLTTNGVEASLPVMGAFEVRHRRIRAWRDYFDMNQFTAQLGNGP